MRQLSVVVGIILMGSWFGLAASAEKGDVAKGKALYGNLCATCHGNAGKGEGPAAAALNPKPKDLTDKAYVSKLEDNYLSNIVAKGGAAVGKSPLMPPFGASLKEQDVRNLIAFVRSLAK